MFWKTKPLPMAQQLPHAPRPLPFEPQRWIAPPPKPMPDIEPALLKISDARTAIERAEKAWNKSQLQDAIRSARYFLDLAEKAIDSQNAGVER